MSTTAYALAASAYQDVGRRSEIDGASPHKLIQLLLDGALAQTREAHHAIERNDIEARGRALNHAIDILIELRTCLDHQLGAEIAANLERLYQHMEAKLVDVHQNANLAELSHVRRLLSDLSDTWTKIGQPA